MFLLRSELGAGVRVSRARLRFVLLVILAANAVTGAQRWPAAGFFSGRNGDKRDRGHALLDGQNHAVTITAMGTSEGLADVPECEFESLVLSSSRVAVEDRQRLPERVTGRRSLRKARVRLPVVENARVPRSDQVVFGVSCAGCHRSAKPYCAPGDRLVIGWLYVVPL